MFYLIFLSYMRITEATLDKTVPRSKQQSVPHHLHVKSVKNPRLYIATGYIYSDFLSLPQF